jgi:5'-nucleotidase
VNGTPGDCVMLGTTLWEKIDLVLSGINIGTNLGNAIWHSGTLAGAKQAALLGLRGIAFSAPATDREQPSFEMLKPWVATVLEALLEVPDMPLINVNFPAKPPRGTVWTRQSMRHYDGKVVPAKDPMGRTHYWFTVVPVEATEEGTDRWAIEQQYVSMTPLRLDLTDEEALPAARKLEGWKKLKFA